MGSVPVLGDKSGRRVSLFQLLQPLTSSNDLAPQEKDDFAGEGWSTLLWLRRLLQQLSDFAFQVDQTPELRDQVRRPAHVDPLLGLAISLDRNVRLVPRHQSADRIRYLSLP